MITAYLSERINRCLGAESENRTEQTLECQVLVK